MMLTATLSEEYQVVEGMPMSTMQMRMCFGVVSKPTRYNTRGFVFPEVIDVVYWYL